MIKKYRCVVTREDEYEIEIDDNVINHEFINEFKEHLYPYETLKEHAGHIAQHRARFESNFIEGYGVPLVNGKRPPFTKKEDVEQGINIKIISEDYYCDVDIEEV